MLSSSDHGPDKHQHQHAPTSGAAQHGAANSGSVSPLLDRPHLQLDRAIAALLVRAGFDSTSNQWRDLLLLPQRPPNQSMRSTSAPGDQIAGVQAHGGAPSGMLGRAHTSHNGHGSQASLGAHEKDTSSSTDTVDGNEPPCKRRATVDKGNFCSQHQMDETGDNDEAEAKPGGDDGGADDAAMTAPQEPVAVLRANLMHHIFAWATKAKKHSELCGRYQPNVMDWAQALHEHGVKAKSLQEAANDFASNPVTLPETETRTTPASAPMPMPQAVPCLLNDPSLRVERPAYMPSHLPNFPDPHTFVRTPVYEPVHASYVQWRRDRTRLTHEAERAAVRLHYRAGQLDAIPLALTPQLQPGRQHTSINVYISRPPPLDYGPLLVAHDINPDAARAGGGGGEEEEEAADMGLDLHLENDAQIAASNEARIKISIELQE